jgi:serine/threonine-protein kinase RsbW
MNDFCVELPLEGEYFTTVRLTTGGLCALAGFDLDATEDFKVCVTESLLILKRNGYKRVSICFEVSEKLQCALTGVGEPTDKEDGIEDEISHALLHALLGEVEFEKDNERVAKISFEA